MDSDITSKEEYEALNIPSIKEIKDTSKQGSVPVDQIIEEIKKSPHLTRLNNLRFVKYKEQFDLAIKKFPSIYRDLDDVYNTKKQHINKQEKI
jgi:hypothetical protein